MTVLDNYLNIERIDKIYNSIETLRPHDLPYGEFMYLAGAMDVLMAMVGNENRFTQLLKIDVESPTESAEFLEELRTFLSQFGPVDIEEINTNVTSRHTEELSGKEADKVETKG